MGEEKAKGWCFCDRFLEFLSLSFSPRFLLPQPSSPPLFSSLSLSLSLIVSPSFLYHLFSLPLTSIPPSPPLITHPPTNKPQPLTAPPSPFPPSFSLPSLPPPPKKPPNIRDKKDQCGQENVVRKRMRRESKQGPPETQL